MTSTTLNGKEYLLVETPEGIPGVFVHTFGNETSLWSDSRYKGSYKKKLPPGDWTLLGLCPDISEDVWAGIVEKNQYGHNGWKTYTEELMFWEKTATESARSLIASHSKDWGRCVLLTGNRK